MSADDERTRELICSQAAGWLVANRAGLSPDERAGFVAWLRTSAVHVEEYLRLVAIARDLRQACAGPENSVEAVVARARAQVDNPREPLPQRLAETLRIKPARLWRPAAVTLATLAAAYLGFAMLRSPAPILRVQAPAPVVVLHFETRHGEQQTHRLADNSILHLNTDSAVTVRYGKSERLVTLTAGEAEFEVVHDPVRAFRVYAGAAQVVDVGTKFDVRLEYDSTVVTVVEGRVAVALSPALRSEGGHAGEEFVQVGAGEQLSITATDWPAKPVTVETERTTAWLDHQIRFEHERLGRVAVEFNRYAPTPIEIGSPELRNLEISGVFATDDTQTFVAFLRSLDGVRVEVSATRILVLQK
jgi:transmembrane sensor